MDERGRRGRDRRSRTTTGSRSQRPRRGGHARRVSARDPARAWHHLSRAGADHRGAEVAARAAASAPGGTTASTRVRLKPTLMLGGYGAVHLRLQLLGPDRHQPRHVRARAEARPDGCAAVVKGTTPWTFDPRSRWSSTSTSASAATPAASPARTCGPTARAPSTCGGTTSRRSRAPATRRAGRTRRRYRGGWERRRRRALRLRSDGRAATLGKHLPQPARCRRSTTTTSRGPTLRGPVRRAAGDDQPIARPISLDHRQADRDRGRAELGRRPGRLDRLRANDPNLDALTPEERAQLFEIERLVFFYLPRMCNHCLNPACVAACPRARSTSAARTASCSSTRRSAAAGGCASRPAPTRRSLQLADRQVGEVHPLLPAARERRGAGVLPLLRRPDPLPGRAALRRRPHPGAAARRDEELVEAQRELLLDPSDPR